MAFIRINQIKDADGSIEPDEFQFHKENNIQVKTAYDCYHEGIEAVAADCVEKMKKFMFQNGR